MASRNIFLPKESNRRIPNGTYGGVRGMNNLYSIGERSEPVSRMLIMPYGTARSSRNADFILIARKGDTTTLGPKGRQSSRRNQITLSAPHRTVRAIFPHTALRIVLGYHICTRIRGFGI